MAYFILCPVPGTMHTRYATLTGDHTVTAVSISRPDGVEVDRPTHIRWRIPAPAEVQVKSWRINETPVSHNGEQPRKPTWRRAGRRAAPTQT